MIKKRLIGLLTHAKKYILYQVVWQWLSLLCQVLVIYCVSMVLEQSLFREITGKGAFGYGAVMAAAMGLRFFCDRQASHASYLARVDVKRILRGENY